jgi:hypothetical protein
LAELRLLALQEAEHTWALIADEVFIPMTEALTLSEGLLVLVELSPTGKISSIQEATTWVLYLVQTYLTSGVTPIFCNKKLNGQNIGGKILLCKTKS